MIEDIKAEVEARTLEIEKYLDAISIFDTGFGKFYINSSDDNGVTKEIDETLIKILKATTYLLLYNLVEITVTLSMKEIAAAINNDKSEFKNFINKIKIKWLRDEYKEISDQCRKEYYQAQDQRLNLINYDVIIRLIDRLLKDQTIVLKDYSLLRHSGNYDLKNIKKLFNEIGYGRSEYINNELRSSGDTDESSSLNQIKQQRNNLSHGSKSFAQIGGDTSVKDLVKYKNDILRFITGFIEDVNRYIERKAYLQSNNLETI